MYRYRVNLHLFGCEVALREGKDHYVHGHGSSVSVRLVELVSIESTDSNSKFYYAKEK